MTTSTLTEHVETETYRDLERMVHGLIWWAVDHRGGRYDDYEDAAQEAYAKAVRTHDPARGQITTHVWWCVRNKLQKVATTERRHRERCRTDLDLDRMPARTKTFDLEVLLVDLSEDARTVVRLVIETPGDLVKLCRMRDVRGELRLDRMRKLLWDTLKGLGWTVGRCVVSFDEVREALT